MDGIVVSMAATLLTLASVVGVSARAVNEHALVLEQSGPGTLDATFGQGGVVVTDLGGDVSGDAIAAGSRIVAAGTLFTDKGSDLALVAYALDGSLDPNFGDGGVVITDLRERDCPADVQVDDEGRLLVLVGVGTPRDTRGAVLARYTADGTLDASFGEGGLVNVGTRLYPVRMALQRDGRIVVAARPRIVLTRYTADGRPDRTFGNDGRVVSPLMSPNDWPVGLAMRPHGELLVVARTAWWADEYYGKFHIALLRYLHDGSMDPSFGQEGIIRYRLSLYGEVIDGEVAPDGKIVALVDAGRQKLWRFRQGGKLDTTFDGDGRALVDSLDAQRIALQTGGGILVVGTGRVGGDQQFGFSLARFLPDGSIDPGFGTGGTTVNLVGDRPAVPYDLVLQSSDRLLVVGSTLGEAESLLEDDLAVARYVAA